MAAFDFFVTLATASSLATTSAATGASSFLQTSTAITTLVVAQYALSYMRRRFK